MQTKRKEEKIMKRIAAILLSLIVAVAFVPMATFAANESVQFEINSTKGGGIYSYSMYMFNLQKYKLDGTVRIVKGDDVESTFYVIPDSTDYVFKGFYADKTKLKTTAKNAYGYALKYDENLKDKQVTAKFAKATKAQKSVAKLKAKNFKSKKANGINTLSWTIGSKVDGYTITIINTTDNMPATSGNVKVAKNGKDAKFKFKYAVKGKKYKAEIVGYKTVKGVKVPAAAKTVTFTGK